MRMVRNAVDRYIEEWNDEHLVPSEKMTKERFCEGIGMSTTHFYRVLRGRSTLKRAVTLFERITKAHPGIWLPPPAFPIGSRSEYRWCAVGARLMEADPRRWEEIMQMASISLDAAEAVSQARIAGDRKGDDSE